MNDRYAPDQLRRFATELLAALGAPRNAAAACSRLLLWYDLGRRPTDGLATLPAMLALLAEGAFEPAAEPPIHQAADGVVLNADRVLPALAVARAAEVAGQLARRRSVSYIGIARVHNLREPAPLAAAVADLALGPFECAAIGRDDAWAAAWPAADGPPLLYESARGSPVDGSLSTIELPHVPWAQRSGPDEIVFVARALNLDGRLERAHHRIAPFVEVAARSRVAGYLPPIAWNECRALAFQQGLPLPIELRAWAARLGVTPPPPLIVPEA